MNCQTCLQSPCICNITELVTYLIGQESTEFIGFRNLEGENNCFLTAAIQSLLNTSPFTQMLSESCLQHKNCIICWFKGLYREILLCKKQKAKELNFFRFRDKLAEIGGHETFAIGLQGDSVEAIEILLNIIHKASRGDFSEFNAINDEECKDECHAHSVCFNRILEKFTCRCGEKQNYNYSMGVLIRMDSSWFFNEVGRGTVDSFNECLNAELHTMYEKSVMKNLRNRFSDVFRNAFKVDETCETRCESCGEQPTKQLILDSEPKIMLFQISWSVLNPKLLQILQFLLSISGKIDLKSLFSNDLGIEMGLKGMIIFLNNHFVYFGLGEDFRWYRVDDSQCQTIGSGRWYDVLLILLYMKGVPVCLIYEEFHIADLSLYKIELLFLEKIVYNYSCREYNDAGMLDHFSEISVNPVQTLCRVEDGTIECINCLEKKRSGKICDCCGFDPNVEHWECESCRKVNDGIVLMCDYCDDIRYKIPFKDIFYCDVCREEKHFRFCYACDFVCNCRKCKKKITAVQSIFCRICKEKCRDGYCDRCKDNEMVCKRCAGG